MKLIVFIVILLISIYSLQQLKDNGELKDIITKTTEQNNLDFNNILEENNHSKNNEIINIFEGISKADKITLSNVTQKWSLTKDTIDKNIEGSLINTIKNILNIVQKKTNKEYYAKNIENVYIMKDKDNNYRAILNTFIYNVHDFHTIKFVIDFVSIDNIVYLNYIDMDESGIKTIIDNYDIKWKSSGILLNYNTFDNDIIKNIDQYYRYKYKLIEYNSDHEYNSSYDNSYTMDQLLVNYIPSEANTIHSPLFCDKTTYQWNNLSLFDISDEDCLINKGSITTYPNYPQFVPGAIINNVAASKEYDWLNDPNERV